MVSCSICGSKKASVVAIIEGVELDVCEGCARLGRIVSRPKPKPKPKIETKPEIEETIVMDFAKRIRKVREKNKMTQEEFAKELNEKLSVMKHVEQGKLVPSLKLAKKIEDKFRIELIEVQSEVSGAGIKQEKSETATLGDLIEIKRKKSH